MTAFVSLPYIYWLAKKEMTNIFNIKKQLSWLAASAKSSCDICQLESNCNGLVKYQNSNERIIQCKLARELLALSIKPENIWVDIKGDNKSDLRFFDGKNRVHALSVNSTPDILIKNENKYIPVEIKHRKENVYDLINKIEIAYSNDQILLIIKPENLHTTGQLFADFFKSHNSVITGCPEVAHFVCHTNHNNLSLFDFYNSTFQNATNIKTTFLILDEIRAYSSRIPTPIWGSLTFESEKVKSSGSSIYAKMIMKETDFPHQPDFIYDICKPFLESKNMQFDFEVVHSIALSLFDAEVYSERITGQQCEILIKKISPQILTITINS